MDNLFYAIEPLISGILMTNIVQFCYHKASRRTGTHWQKWGPVYLVAVATVFSLAQPLAVLLIYVGEVGYPGSKMWTNSSWFPNTVHGVILYLLKWIGMVLLMVGVVQITRLHVKIRDKWQQLRGKGTSEVSKVEVGVVGPPVTESS